MSRSSLQSRTFLTIVLTVVLAGCDSTDRGSVATRSSDTGMIPVAAVGKTPDGWHQSYADAVTESAESGKPILVDFTGSDWCGWCIKLDEEVFGKEEFKSWASKNVVLLKLDFPQSIKQSEDVIQQNHALQQKYAIRGFPTILFIDSQGKLIDKYGYDKGGPEVWTRKASAMLKK